MGDDYLCNNLSQPILPKNKSEISMGMHIFIFISNAILTHTYILIENEMKT